MVALTASRNTPAKAAIHLSVPVAAGVKIFAGSLVVANASGFAAPGATAANLSALGRASESVDNTVGANGDKLVIVDRKAAFKFVNLPADAVTQADFCKVCYIVDDQTVAKTSNAGARSVAGKVVGIDSDGVWVEFQ